MALRPEHAKVVAQSLRRRHPCLTPFIDKLYITLDILTLERPFQNCTPQILLAASLRGAHQRLIFS